MELIKKTRSQKNKKGNWIYFGLFLCPFCLQEVERQLSAGRKQKSCGCVRYKLSAESNTGKKRTEEQRKNISNSHKGLQVGQKDSMYGKNQTEETKQKIREARKLQESPMKGKSHSKESRQKIREAKIGENHW